MTPATHMHRPRRETQVMDILYMLGEASVNDVTDRIDDGSGYNAVRAVLGVLVDKGEVTYRREGRRYVYRPVTPRPKAQRNALQHVVDTLFQGSTPRAVATLLDMSASELDPADLEELARRIDRARSEEAEEEGR